MIFFLNNTSTTEIYTLSLHDALPIWRCAGRDGDRLPARQDPGRVDALRAPQARRVAADRRRQHLPRPAPRRGPAEAGGAGPGHRGGEAVAAAAAGRLPGPARRRGTGRAGPAAGGGDVGRQRVRGAGGRRPVVLAGPDLGGLLRGGRPVPPECVRTPVPPTVRTLTVGPC